MGPRPHGLPQSGINVDWVHSSGHSPVFHTSIHISCSLITFISSPNPSSSAAMSSRLGVFHDADFITDLLLQQQWFSFLNVNLYVSVFFIVKFLAVFFRSVILLVQRYPSCWHLKWSWLEGQTIQWTASLFSHFLLTRYTIFFVPPVYSKVLLDMQFLCLWWSFHIVAFATPKLPQSGFLQLPL